MFGTGKNIVLLHVWQILYCYYYYLAYPLLSCIRPFRLPIIVPLSCFTCHAIIWEIHTIAILCVQYDIMGRVRGEDLSCYSNKIQSVFLKKNICIGLIIITCQLSAVTNVYQTSNFLQHGGENQLAERCETKLRLSHPMYEARDLKPTQLNHKHLHRFQDRGLTDLCKRETELSWLLYTYI